MGWYTGGLNQRTITAGQALYSLVTTLVAAGWVAKGSGDGISAYSATDGTAVTNGTVGPNGFLNAGAWMRVQSPKVGLNGQKREFVFQQGNGGGIGSTVNIRIKYSPNAFGVTGFTGGAPSAVRVPSATDEVTVAGSGTDAAPTYVSWGANNDYQFAFHVLADNDGDHDYAWYCFQTVQSNGAFSNSMSMAMDTMAQGTTQAGDQDLCVIYWNGAGNWQTDLYNVSGFCKAFVGGISAGNWVTVTLPQFTQSGLASGGLQGSDAQTNLDSSVTPHWTRVATAQPGSSIKGYSNLFQYGTSVRGAMYPVANNATSGGDRLLLVGDSPSRAVSVPWPPRTPCYVC